MGKNIKSSVVHTQEGFEFKNLSTFESMEYGPDGALACDLYFQKQKIGHFLQEGNGGCAIFNWENNLHAEEIKVIKIHILRCLKRIAPESYGPDSEYDWLRNRKAEDIDGDDIETIINLLYDRHWDLDQAAKAMRAGYGGVAIIDCDYTKNYLKCAFTKEQAIKWLNNNHPEIKFKDVYVIMQNNIKEMEEL